MYSILRFRGEGRGGSIDDGRWRKGFGELLYRLDKLGSYLPPSGDGKGNEVGNEIGGLS